MRLKKFLISIFIIVNSNSITETQDDSDWEEIETQ